MFFCILVLYGCRINGISNVSNSTTGQLTELSQINSYSSDEKRNEIQKEQLISEQPEPVYVEQTVNFILPISFYEESLYYAMPTENETIIYKNNIDLTKPEEIIRLAWQPLMPLHAINSDNLLIGITNEQVGADSYSQMTPYILNIRNKQRQQLVEGSLIDNKFYCLINGDSFYYYSYPQTYGKDGQVVIIKFNDLKEFRKISLPRVFTVHGDNLYYANNKQLYEMNLTSLVNKQLLIHLPDGNIKSLFIGNNVGLCSVSTYLGIQSIVFDLDENKSFVINNDLTNVHFFEDGIWALQRNTFFESDDPMAIGKIQYSLVHYSYDGKMLQSYPEIQDTLYGVSDNYIYYFKSLKERKYGVSKVNYELVRLDKI